MEKGKHGIGAIEEQIQEIVHTAQEVGKEIWEDVKGIIEKQIIEQRKGLLEGNQTEKAEPKPDPSAAPPARRRLVRFI